MSCKNDKHFTKNYNFSNVQLKFKNYDKKLWNKIQDSRKRHFNDSHDLIYIYEWFAEQRQTTLNEAQLYITSEH